MNTKDKVALIVARVVSEAEDNLYRARRQFEDMDEDEMKAPYGLSGKTCQEVLNEYKNAAADAANCASWVRAQEN